MEYKRYCSEQGALYHGRPPLAPRPLIDAFKKPSARRPAHPTAATVLFSPGLSLAYAASVGAPAGTGGWSASRNSGGR